MGGELGRFSLELSPVTTYAFGRLIPSKRTFEQQTSKEDVYATLEVPGHDVLVVPELRLNLQYDFLALEKFRVGLMGGGVFGYGLGSGTDNPFLEFGWHAGPRLTFQLLKHFGLGIDLLYAGRHITGLDTDFSYSMHGFTGAVNAIIYPDPKNLDYALVMMYGYNGLFNQSRNEFESSHDVGLAFRIYFGGDSKTEEISKPNLDQLSQLDEGWNLVRKVEGIMTDDWLDTHANELAVDKEVVSALRLDAINNVFLWLLSGYPGYSAKLSIKPFEKVDLSHSLKLPWKGLPSLKDYLTIVYRTADNCSNKHESAKLLRGSRKVVADIYHFLVNELEKEQERIVKMGLKLLETHGKDPESLDVEIQFIKYLVEVRKYSAVLKRAQHLFSFLNAQQSYYFVGSESVYSGEKSDLNSQISAGWCLESGNTSPTNKCQHPEISIPSLEKIIEAQINNEEELK